MAAKLAEAVSCAVGVPSVSDFYPPGAKRRGEEGRVVVYVLLDKKEGQPSLVELKDSSGFGELDVAGVKMGCGSFCACFSPGGSAIPHTVPVRR